MLQVYQLPRQIVYFEPLGLGLVGGYCHDRTRSSYVYTRLYMFVHVCTRLYTFAHVLPD